LISKDLKGVDEVGLVIIALDNSFSHLILMTELWLTEGLDDVDNDLLMSMNSWADVGFFGWILRLGRWWILRLTSTTWMTLARRIMTVDCS